MSELMDASTRDCLVTDYEPFNQRSTLTLQQYSSMNFLLFCFLFYASKSLPFLENRLAKACPCSEGVS